MVFEFRQYISSSDYRLGCADFVVAGTVFIVEFLPLQGLTVDVVSQAAEEAIKKINGDGSGRNFQLDIDVLKNIEESVGAILKVLADPYWDEHLPTKRQILQNGVREVCFFPMKKFAIFRQYLYR